MAILDFKSTQLRVLLGLISLIIFLAAIAVWIQHDPGKCQALAAFHPSEHDKPLEESVWCPASWVPITTFTAALAVATAGLWIFTALLWITTSSAVTEARDGGKAAREANKISRESLIASQRAWLSIDSVSLGDGSVFTHDQADIFLRITGKHFGQTPALDVWFEVRFILLSSTADYLQEEKTFLARLKSNKAPRGQNVFPGEPINFSVRFSSAMPQPLVESPTHLIGVFVGLKYSVIGSEEPRITANCYTAHIETNKVLPYGEILEMKPMLFQPGTIT